MSAFLAQLRAARVRPIEACGLRFTIRRPTDMEMARLAAKPLDAVDTVLRHVIGWEVTERDILPGSTADTVVGWDPELFAEWIVDRPDLWEPLGKAVMDLYGAHVAAREAAAKK